MTPLTPKQSTAAAVAILALLVASVVAAVAVPIWMLHRHYDDALADASQRLERYYRIAGMREGLRKKTAELAALGTAGHFLKGASPALAAAEIQERAKGIVEASGAKLNSMQILAPRDDGRFRQISVTVQLTGNLPAIKKMLHALESSRPYLFVDNLSIRAPIFPTNRNAPTTEPDLAIQFDLAGYAVKDEK